MLRWFSLSATCIVLLIWIVSAKCTIGIVSGRRLAVSLYRGDLHVTWSSYGVTRAAFRHFLIEGIHVRRDFDFGLGLPAFRVFGNGDMWTCSLPLWMLFVATSAVTAGVWIRHHRARGSTELPACPACGYCLKGNVSGRCPECGHVVDLSELEGE